MSTLDRLDNILKGFPEYKRKKLAEEMYQDYEPEGQRFIGAENSEPTTFPEVLREFAHRGVLQLKLSGNCDRGGMMTFLSETAYFCEAEDENGERHLVLIYRVDPKHRLKKIQGRWAVRIVDYLYTQKINKYHLPPLLPPIMRTVEKWGGMEKRLVDFSSGTIENVPLSERGLMMRNLFSVLDESERDDKEHEKVPAAIDEVSESVILPTLATKNLRIVK